jgi:hypothetical protein
VEFLGGLEAFSICGQWTKQTKEGKLSTTKLRAGIGLSLDLGFLAPSFHSFFVPGARLKPGRGNRDGLLFFTPIFSCFPFVKQRRGVVILLC